MVYLDAKGEVSSFGHIYLDNLNRQQTEYLLPCHEIAELTGKRHAHVCRDIRNMLEQLGHSPDLGNAFMGTYINENNRSMPCYHLPRRECEILVCGYDVVRRAAVIDRWLELETKQRQLPNMTPGAAKVYCRSRDDRLIGIPVMTVTKNPCVYDLIVSGEILRWYVCRPDEHHIHTGGNQ